ncbi:MAG: hypothetical protein JEY99_19620 [Spirochaetales bacterium]|nr:hypothetical protein [Spirochaetales bacterium]
MKKLNLNKPTPNTLLILLLALTALLFFGCPSSLNEAMVTLAEDEVAPSFSLNPISSFRSQVTITGTVIDYTSSSRSETGGLKNDTLKWEILDKATTYNGTYELLSDNSFSFTIPDTTTLTETIVVRVYATDLSGNTGYADLSLTPYSQGPYISIETPENNEIWANELTKTVRGTVQNSSSDTGVDEVDFTTLEVYLTATINSSDTGMADNFILEQTDENYNGRFSFTFPTENISSRQPITIQVRDKNNNLTTETLMLLSSSEAPIITLAEPGQNTVFNKEVTVTGNLKTSDTATPKSEGIITFSIAILGTTVQGTYTLNTATETWTPLLTGVTGFTFDYADTGNFSFTFDTTGMEGNLLIELIAENINGNQTTQTLTLRNDNQGPEININTPLKNSYYYSSLTVTGSVSNNGETDTGLDEIGSLTWSVPGTDIIGGSIVYDETGAFSFPVTIPSTQAGNLTIIIEGKDINNNTTDEYLTLLDQTDGPVIDIDSPDCYPYYSREFSLTGTISHLGGLTEVDATAGSLQWMWDGGDWTNFTMNDITGDFTITGIDSTSRTGTQSIIVKATDNNSDTTEERLILLNDGIGLDIEIISPESGSCYATAVPVEVEVNDFADLSLITWEIVGQASGSFTENGTGNYTSTINTGSYSNNLTLRIIGTDVHNNSTQKEIALLYADSTIPTFSVETDNASVFFHWDAVPLATEYNIYYTDDGASPILGAASYPTGNTKKLSNMGSGDDIAGLQNGDRHVFILEAVLNGGFDPSYSKEIVAVPLSPLSYCPNLRQEESESIILEWPDYGGDTGFTVWRSLDEGGSWQKISGELVVNSFTDSGVSMGDLAWYKIIPVQYSDVESYYSAIKVHYLDTTTEIKSNSSIIQDHKYELKVTEYSGSKYLVARTGPADKIEIYDITDPKNISRKAYRDLEDASCNPAENYPIRCMATFNNYIFTVTEDNESDGDQLFVYSFDHAEEAITLESTLSLSGISFNSNITDCSINGISIWYGDEGDLNSDSEYWIFLNDDTHGMFIAKMIPGSGTSIVNLIEGIGSPAAFDSTPLLYNDGSSYNITIIATPGATTLYTIEDFPSFDLTDPVTDISDFDSGTTLTDPPSWARYTATDSNHAFIVNQNTLYAYDLFDNSLYASYDFYQAPSFIECTGDYIITASDNQYLTSFKISDIDFVNHTMSVDKEWRTLYTDGVVDDGIAYLSTIWENDIDVIGISYPALTITPVNSLSGSTLDQWNLHQSILQGDKLYTYRRNSAENSGQILKWDLTNLQAGIPPVIQGEAAEVSNNSGGLFAAGNYCFNVRKGLYETDCSTTTATTINYKSHPDVGKIDAQSNFQTAERVGHYLFTGGVVASGSPRVIGTYDIGPLSNYDINLISYQYAATANWLNFCRVEDRLIALQSNSEELVIMDISSPNALKEVNRIDIPFAISIVDKGFTFLPYKGFIYFSYVESGYLKIAALDTDYLDTGSWDDIVEIEKYNITTTYGSNLTTALTVSGDYLFAAYSSFYNDSGINGIKASSSLYDNINWAPTGLSVTMG